MVEKHKQSTAWAFKAFGPKRLIRKIGAPMFARVALMIFMIIVIILAVFTNVTARAGGSVGGDAKEWTQLLNNAELGKIVGLESDILSTQGKSLTAQLEQLRTQISSYEIMLRNIKSLPRSLRRQAMQAVTDLRGIAQQTGSMANSGRLLDTFLRSDQITDPLFEKSGLDRAKISERYDGWQKKWDSSVRTNLKNLDLTMKDVESEARFIDKLSEKFGSEEGQLQALQGANKMASSVARQLNSLRMITSTQAEQNAVAWGRVMEEMDRKEASQRLHEREVHETIESLQQQTGHRTMQEIFGFGGR